MRFVAFPGMAELESAWHDASEMAADEEAVSSASEALDLASAVIRLSRLPQLGPSSALTTALVHNPPELINARVKRLIDWKETRSEERYSVASALIVAVAVTILAANYSSLLVQTHAVTEWLVQ
jgi:hypothetical protein